MKNFTTGSKYNFLEDISRSDSTKNEWLEIQERISKIKAKKKSISDIYQIQGDKELQYVDLVMEGGGVNGIALIGYLYGLERFGIRFLSIGGTSAGAIIALLLASLDGGKEQTKSERLLNVILTQMELSKFVDCEEDIKEEVERYVLDKMKAQEMLARGKEGLENLMRYKVLAAILPLILSAIYLTLKLKIKIGILMKAIKVFLKNRGLNPGDEFYEWLKGILQGEGFSITTNSELKERVEKVPDGIIHREQSNTEIKCRLGIVAADITTETKVIFPDYAPMYWNESELINPAAFVRASMSILFFFFPYTVNNIRTIDDVANKWKNIAKFDGNVPSSVSFADGGILSNFPIDIFHVNDRMPERPTFGVKLGSKHRDVHEIDSVFRYTSAMINSMRHYGEYDFIRKNPDYRKLITYIDTSGLYWLDFNMSADRMKKLFIRGVNAALGFIDGFDWADYKETRRGILNASKDKDNSPNDDLA